MHTLIISGGTIDTDFALDLLKKEKYDHIIGVDGALKFCKEQNKMCIRDRPEGVCKWSSSKYCAGTSGYEI